MSWLSWLKYFSDIIIVFKDSSILWKILTIIFICLFPVMVCYYAIPVIRIHKANFYVTNTHFLTDLIYQLDGTLFHADIGLLVKVVNNKPNISNVSDYKAEAKISGKWFKIFVIPFPESKNFFFSKSNDFKNCVNFEFKDDMFDSIAKDKKLEYGDHLKGWVFFTVPEEATKLPHKIEKVKLCIENSLGEIQEVILPRRGAKPREAGESLLSSTELKIIKTNIDLSKYSFSHRP